MDLSLMRVYLIIMIFNYKKDIISLTVSLGK